MILNKIDIAGPSALTVKDHRDLFSASISCKTHAGIDSFRSKLLEIAIPQQSTGTTSVVVQNIRHKGALDNAFSDLSKALISLEVGRGNEFISFDLRAAVDHLGEIIGVVTSEDILNNIFSRFCIGK
jgi:tRNA modification GTPase